MPTENYTTKSLKGEYERKEITKIRDFKPSD